MEHAKSSDACHFPPLPVGTILWAQEPHGMVCHVRANWQRDWHFGASHSKLVIYTLWCGSHIKVLEDFGKNTRLFVSTDYAFHLWYHNTFYFVSPQKFCFPAACSQLDLGSLGLIFSYCYREIYWHPQFFFLFFSSHWIRLLVKACHRLWLAMEARPSCPPPRGHWGPPLCPNPAAHLCQLQPRPQLPKARWDT